MRPIRSAVLISVVLVLAACGSAGGQTPVAGTPTGTSAGATSPPTTPPTTPPTSTTTTTADPLGVPYLPSPLPSVADPGTIDPILGRFPTSDSRSYQYAWVNFAKNGREMAQLARSLDSTGYLKNESVADIYYAGEVACADLLMNYSVSGTATFVTEYFTEPDKKSSEVKWDSSVIVAAMNTLCPSVKPIIDDADYLTPTPEMLRTVLGVSDSDLTDDQANQFANWVCDKQKSGTTQARLITSVATKHGYPDNLAERLVQRVDRTLC